MRTSHKRTHSQPPAGRKSVWLRLLVLTLLLGGLAYGAIQLGVRSAKADELETARAKLEKARADFHANPTKESGEALKAAVNAYKTMLTALPAPVAQAQTAVESVAANFAISDKVSDMSPAAPSPSAAKLGFKRKNEKNETPLRSFISPSANSIDPRIQSTVTPGPAVVSAPIANFDGIDMDDQAAVLGRFVPNDPNADVGPNHVVLTVNSAFRVYNKTGTPLTGTIFLNQLFDPLGGACTGVAAGNDGDPIVLYDPLADRWLISEFCLTVTAGSTHQLIAISRTG